VCPIGVSRLDNCPSGLFFFSFFFFARSHPLIGSLPTTPTDNCSIGLIFFFSSWPLIGSWPTTPTENYPSRLINFFFQKKKLKKEREEEKVDHSFFLSSSQHSSIFTTDCHLLPANLLSPSAASVSLHPNIRFLFSSSSFQNFLS
jgi:hypothetical protein